MQAHLGEGLLRCSGLAFGRLLAVQLRQQRDVLAEGCDALRQYRKICISGVKRLLWRHSTLRSVNGLDHGSDTL